MKRISILRFTLGWFFFLAVLAPASGFSEDAEELLYYESESTFDTANRFELRANSGMDFSNPYVFLYTVGATASYSLDRSVSLGLEWTQFYSQRRASAEAIDEVLARYGYVPDTFYPEYSAVGVVRLTPFSGMVNFLDRGVVLADISLLLRAGTVRYYGTGLAPLVGTGIEVFLGITRNVGIAGALLWDAQQPPGHRWESRVGFRLSPTWRF